MITLGIIGVVAAMTIPNLTSNYRKRVVETRLAKFYTVMNQAVMQSELVNGPKEYWDSWPNGFEEDDEGNLDKTHSPVEDWFNKYLRPYLKYSSIKINNAAGNVMVYFLDGSLVLMSGSSLQFWPEAKDFVDYQVSESGDIANNMEISGIKYFTFFFNPCVNTPNSKYHYKKGVEPYKYDWDGTIDMLKDNSAIGCKANVSNERAYCAALLQMNGWKIPDDYPFKF